MYIYSDSLEKAFACLTSLTVFSTFDQAMHSIPRVSGLLFSSIMFTQVVCYIALTYFSTFHKVMHSSPRLPGSLFSSIVFTQVVCYISSTFLFNTIYADTVSFFSGFVFLLQAGLCLITVAVLL